MGPEAVGAQALRRAQREDTAEPGFEEDRDRDGELLPAKVARRVFFIACAFPLY
jgi:hypothetical protein